jgi:uncharacterized protein YcgI (DUF1989 family)
VSATEERVSATDTTYAAREHARAQAGRSADAMPVLPASAWPDPPAGVAAEDLVWAETVADGGYASKVLARGTTIRLIDTDGHACANVLLYNADAPWERLNVADTVKVPWQAYLGPGHPLLSDQGRVLATVVADDSGHHDALCGTTARDLFVVAAAKHGLEPRDIPPSVSFFEGVLVEPDGALTFAGGAGAGRSVDLRCELPVIVLIANAPHPIDPREGHACTGLEVVAWRGAPTRPGDPLWASTPELERAFLNTQDYCAARGI